MKQRQLLAKPLPEGIGSDPLVDPLHDKDLGAADCLNGGVDRAAADGTVLPVTREAGVRKAGQRMVLGLAGDLVALFKI